MDGATGILIKIGVRLVVFTAVFWLAAHKSPKIVIETKWATPIIAFVFAILNTTLYWLLMPVLNVVTLGAVGFVMPFVVNALLLLATVRVFQIQKLRAMHLEIQGVFTMVWLAAALTVVHGALWVALDYLPTR
jgi:Mycobacterial 4 TMS phage holin, superfamily IV